MTITVFIKRATDFLTSNFTILDNAQNLTPKQQKLRKKWKCPIKLYFHICLEKVISKNYDSSCVENDKTFGPFLVHDSVATFSTSNGVSLSNFVLGVALATNVDHRLPNGSR